MSGPLAYRDYPRDALIRMIVDGSVAGQTSPFLDAATLDAALDACHLWDLDPAALFGWTATENANGTNISDSLRFAHNYAGIKYVGQSRAQDGSKTTPQVTAPASEGYDPYCVFANDADFFWTLARNIVSLLPDDFLRGDLNRIAWYYTLGNDGLPHADAGEEHAKYARYKAFRAYGGTPMPAPQPSGVAASRIADEAMRHRNEKRSGAYDSVNGDHFWCNPATDDYWCLSFVDSAHRALGIAVVLRPTAADKGRALRDQGFMHVKDRNPPRGAVISLDEAYWQYGGHTAISLGDGTMVGTCAPEGVGIRPIPFNSPGYMGWSLYPGVVADDAAPLPAPAPQPTPAHPSVIFAPRTAPTHLDGGMQAHLWEYANVGRTGGDRIESLNADGEPTGMYRAWCADLMNGGPAGHPWGPALSHEYDLPGGRRCQDFALGVATAIRTADGAWTIYFN